MYCYKHAEEEEEEKAAVRVKGERGRSRFTVTFSPVLPKQQQTAVVVGGFFFRSALYVPQWLSRIFGRIFFLPLGKNIFGKMSLLLRLANFLFLSLFFAGTVVRVGKGKQTKMERVNKAYLIISLLPKA